ncbi:sulfite exporter TauE/SafE family protein [Prosthecobacter sp. SYSU 5D2]|uniref:sulfite exporter TauE/SafE family protein n=1 Tax=Prosthecobacter sp. SYSU 5D2 TaxID=3134134 RepID=UPI0031FED53D
MIPDWLQQHTLFTGDLRILILASIAALCIGLSKSGLSGTATLNVVLMAQAFGAKASVGLVLPLLIVADFMGYFINRHGGSWRRIIPMAPPAILGVIAGYFLLGEIDNGTARMVIGWLIISLLGFKLLLDASQGALQVLTSHRLFAWAMGLCAGVTTMLANAAGPVMTVYLLSQRLEKKEHLGVFSRFFLFINLFKVPFSANLGIIHPQSLMTNLVLLPAVVLGILLGWQILKRIPQKPFEWTLFVMTLVAAVWLIIG